MNYYLNSAASAIVIFIFLLGCLDLKSQSNQPDTLPALVQYGSKNILDEKFYSCENPCHKIDSLISKVESDFVSDLLFIKKYLKVNSNERMIVIDSLFDINPVRYDLINELERMIFYISDEITEIKKNNTDLTGDSEFPSNEIYKVWNTKKLWNSITIESDSSYLVKLTDADKKYFHPICRTTLNKYGGKVSSKQGWRDGKRHNGVDIACDQWDSLFCAFDGKVRFAKEFEGYGKVVVVRHFNGLETLYAHLAKIKVKPGQDLKAGELVGFAGNTGNSDGSHLHFEMRFKDQPLNPESIVDFNQRKIKSDSLLIRKAGNGFVALPLEQPYHIIEKGDYPMKIATRYGMSIQAFTEINEITSKTKLKIGDRVIIK